MNHGRSSIRHGRFYTSEMDMVLGESLTKLEKELKMSPTIIIEVTKGLLANAKPEGGEKFAVTVPYGTNLQEKVDGRTLMDALKTIAGVDEVIVGKGNGVSVERMPITNRTGV